MEKARRIFSIHWSGAFRENKKLKTEGANLKIFPLLFWQNHLIFVFKI